MRILNEKNYEIIVCLEQLTIFLPQKKQEKVLC